MRQPVLYFLLLKALQLAQVPSAIWRKLLEDALASFELADADVEETAVLIPSFKKDLLVTAVLA